LLIKRNYYRRIDLLSLRHVLQAATKPNDIGSSAEHHWTECFCHMYYSGTSSYSGLHYGDYVFDSG